MCHHNHSISTSQPSFSLLTFTNSPDTYYYTKVLIDGQEDVILDEGPISITSHCTGNIVHMKLKLHNTAEDMLVFGDISDDINLDNSPIGNSSKGVLDTGTIYEGICGVLLVLAMIMIMEL